MLNINFYVIFIIWLLYTKFSIIITGNIDMLLNRPVGYQDFPLLTKPFQMAELIDACENGHDHDQDPVVIKGRYTGVKLNAGFYSRLRELSTESSYTVVG